jgi:hypothetical protein
MRRIRTVISPTGHISISGNAGLDLTYRELFQSATTELQQGNQKTELGVRLIVFGCFWLEAKCNDTLRKLLEHSTKFGIAATALWEHAVERASFHAKFAIVSAFAKSPDEKRVKTLKTQMKQVFDLRNRLAHFKDKDVEIAKGTDVHEVVKVLKNLPEADLIKHLKPPRLQTYGTSIAEGVAWLSEVEQQHLPSKAVPRTLH